MGTKKSAAKAGLSANFLKVIACLSMACDHVGYLLLPNLVWLRWIGRLAMPIFAFFIAEGCKKTRSPGKYLLRVFLLGLLCQAVYIGEDLLTTGKITSVYLNILLTFTLSMLLCFALLRMQKSDGKFFAGLCFLALLGGCLFLCEFATGTLRFRIDVDYGMAGILLPLFALPFEEKSRRMASFTVGTVCYCLLWAPVMPFCWFSLLALPLLWLYNGSRGHGGAAAKWGFYLFYPAHLAIIYLISYFVK